MLSFLSPLFLAGAAAAAVPIVLHLLKREPEPRVKFAAVQLLQAGAGRAHRPAAPARAAAAGAARDGAGAAGARVCPAVSRVRRGRRRRPASTVVALDTSLQHVGARAGSSAPGSWRRTRSPRRRPAICVGVVTFADEAEIVAQPSGRSRAGRGGDRCRRAPGFGATRYRAALSAPRRSALAGRHGTVVVVTDLQESGWDAGDRASVPDGDDDSRSPTSARCRRTSRSPRCGRCRIASSPPCATAAPRPRDARVHLTVDGRAGGRRDGLARRRTSRPTRRLPARRAARRARSASTIPTGSRRTTSATPCSAARGKPSVLVVTGIGRSPAATRSTCSRRWRRGTPADAAFQVAGVGGAAARRMVRGSADAARGGGAAVDARARAPRSRSCWPRTRSSGGGLLHRRGPGGRRRRGRRRARRRIDAAHRDGRRAPSRRRARWRRPTSAIRCSRRSRGNPASLGLVTFQNAARDRRQRVPDAGAVHHRRNGADRLSGRRGPRARPGVGPEQPLERLSRCTRRSCRSCTRSCATWRARARTPVDYLIADAPAGVPPRAGHRRADRRGAGAAARARSRSTSIRASRDPARLSADEFRVGGDAAEGRRGGVETRGEAREQEDRQHLWRYALAAMAVLLAAEGVLAARTA